VRREDLKLMKPGSVIVDVAVDQGGCVETIRPTTHADPIYVVDGVIHYGVANMPGAVSRTSTLALTNATFPYALTLANKGWSQACQDDRALALGVNVVDGKVTYPGVAEAFDLDYTPVEECLEPESGRSLEPCGGPAPFAAEQVPVAVMRLDNYPSDWPLPAYATTGPRPSTCATPARVLDPAARPGSRPDRPRHCTAGRHRGPDPAPLRARAASRHLHHQHALHDRRGLSRRDPDPAHQPGPRAADARARRAHRAAARRPGARIVWRAGRRAPSHPAAAAASAAPGASEPCRQPEECACRLIYRKLTSSPCGRARGGCP
jgi:hypothetical protein